MRGVLDNNRLQEWPYANFTRAEMSCRHCGDCEMEPEFMQKLQLARNIAGEPFNMNSCYRCAIHNAAVGGAPMSQHKFGRAGDISLVGVNRFSILKACQKAGFTGFGYYQTFLHVDTGAARTWIGAQSEKQKEVIRKAWKWKI